MNNPATDPRLEALVQRAAEATRAGRVREAVAAWSEVLTLDPKHLAALTQLGQAAWSAGDLEAARAAFERAAAIGPAEARHWVNLAVVLERQGDEARLDDVLTKALALEPRELLALLMRGRLHERAGRRAQAAAAYGAAAAVAPAMDRLRPDLRAPLAQAIEFSRLHRQAIATFVDEHLADELSRFQGPEADRFRLSLDILVGRKQRHDAQPLIYYYPKLEPVEFFERQHFPWLPALEEQTAAVRDEFMAVYAADQGFVPYIQYGQDQPVDQWAALNHNPAWSVLHLVQRGKPVPANAARCPQTLALWSQHVPAPRQSGRTPVAMFSLLKGHTHIPPHTGASNVRLVAHLPLIVPAGCRFRVGNTVREWREGQAWVFDDTIEHEAWNDSDQLRVVLIFDVWHPALSAEERHLIGRLNEVLDDFGGGAAPDYTA
jgi:aspartate beta-hydroxylase